MSRREHTTQNQSPLPPEYRQLEYLESNGYQIIKAPYTCGRTLSYVYFETEGYPIQQNVSTDYGAFIGGGASSTFELYYGRTNNGFFSFFINNSPSVFNYGHQRNTWYKLKAIFENGVKTLFVDDVIVGQESTTSTITMSGTPVGLWLFRYNYSGTRGEYLEGRIKRTYVKMIGTNGEIEYDFIPALRIADSKPGLYDLVNDQFYTNAGTGEFLYA